MKATRWIVSNVWIQFNILLSHFEQKDDKVQWYRNTDQNLHVKNVTQTSLIKVALLKGMWISRLKVQNVVYWSYYFDNLAKFYEGKVIRNRDKEMKPAP